jgi:hypothetical protein
MKNRLLILSLLLFTAGITSTAQTASTTTEKDPVQEKTNTVANRLKLNEETKRSVFNIFSQTKNRIEDLDLGTPNYAKLIKYIDEERSGMLKAALSPEEFSEYKKIFVEKDNKEINAYIKINNKYVDKKNAEELKAKKTNEKIMQADKLKIKKEEEKEKLAEKKEDAKLKATEKRAAEKQKAEAKKEKSKLKQEEKKRKEKEKKEAAKQKAMEKKQKQLEKKQNKK